MCVLDGDLRSRSATRTTGKTHHANHHNGCHNTRGTRAAQASKHQILRSRSQATHQYAADSRSSPAHARPSISALASRNANPIGPLSPTPLQIHGIGDRGSESALPALEPNSTGERASGG